MKKVKTSHKGRKCRVLHCKHILSIYNHELYCHVHLLDQTMSMPTPVSASYAISAHAIRGRA
jgi:hypothetical protein